MTEVFEFADRAVEAIAADHPVFATFMGVAGYDDRMSDWSLAAADARYARHQEWLVALDAMPIANDDDRLAVAFMRERLGAQVEQHRLGEHLRDVNVIGSPVQACRDVFTLMATATDDDWRTIAARLEAVPWSLGTLRSVYEEGIARGVLPARRQVLGGADMAAVAAGLAADGTRGESWFDGFVAQYAGGDDALSARLREAAAGAAAAYADLALWMRGTWAPVALEQDGVGRDRYTAMARVYLGAEIDPEETYAWGWQELAALTHRMNDVASRLYGGVTPAEAQARLDTDPAYRQGDAEGTRAWLQQVTDETIASFNGTYFDIPEEMLRCEVVIAPPGAAAAPYYTPPSEDFSRSGRTWLPVLDESSLRAWWLLSVWYHEAVPGHHLQVAYAMLQRERLSRFQRVEFVSGHGEGWALYAERLMDELGYFSDPGYELGFLSNQAMRAVRIVLDIGLHLGLEVPADIDPVLVEGLAADPRGRVWDRETARDFLAVRGLQSDTFAASEVDRYLGIPGQAISYKVGERVWLAAREDAKAREGEAFDLKAWHMRALALGSVGLDVLRAELARG
ncbi:MAG: DUF885 family protein [Frankiales bacterium]|nr:DUF885 family protein [Frankiales bacterium]